MVNETIVLKRIQKRYSNSNMKMHAMRFLQDYSESFSFYLGDKSNIDSFITVEPMNSQLNGLLSKKYYHNISYDIEKIIGQTIYSLINYGTAYIYVNPDVEIVENDVGEKHERIKSLEIVELRGIISHRSEHEIEFYSMGYSKEIKKVTLKTSNFAILSLKDLGYSKRYFHKIACQLDKYDATSDTLDLINVEGYSFTEHIRHNNVKALKLTNKIGWTNMCEGLSDSNILYRRIKMNKLRISMINYVIEKLNLLAFNILPQDRGRIKVNYRAHDYDDWWEDFTKGKLSISELSKRVL